MFSILSGLIIIAATMTIQNPSSAELTKYVKIAHEKQLKQNFYEKIPTNWTKSIKKE
jgi:hypothetical protein